MTKKFRKYSILLMVALLPILGLQAEEAYYWCDAGIQFGADYYMGDARPIKYPNLFIFRNVQPDIGAQFRWKIDQRWSLTAKMQIENMKFEPTYGLADVQMLNTDITAEFNFFRFGSKQYDNRIKPCTPYIFLGIGWSGFGHNYGFAADNAGYVPFGIGFKWMFAKRCCLLATWQHQLYFTDSLEEPGSEKGSDFNDKNRLNGANWFNCDMTGNFNIGITFSFGRQKHPCPWCKD